MLSVSDDAAAAKLAARCACFNDFGNRKSSAKELISCVTGSQGLVYDLHDHVGFYSSFKQQHADIMNMVEAVETISLRCRTEITPATQARLASKGKFTASPSLVKFLFNTGAIVATAARLIGPCERICWWELGYRFRMVFHHLDWIFEGLYVPISERIDVEWAVDEDFLNLSLVSSPEIRLNCFQVEEDWRAGVGWVQSKE